MTVSNGKLGVKRVDLVQAVFEGRYFGGKTLSVFDHIFLLEKKFLELFFNVQVADQNFLAAVTTMVDEEGDYGFGN